MLPVTDFQSHIMISSLVGRGNQFIQLVKVLYCKLLTNGKKIPTFPHMVQGLDYRPQRWETRVLVCREIGVGLAGFGITFLFLGVLLFFDRGLLAIGNILFICGLVFVVGLERTFRFFFQKHKLRATGAFLGGILVVLMGWPVVGMVVEIYGFILLFSGFLPVAVNFLRRVPVLGMILNLPGIRAVINKIGEPQGMV